VTDPAAVAAIEAPPTVLVASYEALRRVALGRSGPDDAPPLGFTVLLRHGMMAWLRAWAVCPGAPAPIRPAGALPVIPSLVHREMVHVWAQMALAHQETSWI